MTLESTDNARVHQWRSSPLTIVEFTLDTRVTPRATHVSYFWHLSRPSTILSTFDAWVFPRSSSHANGNKAMTFLWSQEKDQLLHDFPLVTMKGPTFTWFPFWSQQKESTLAWLSFGHNKMEQLLFHTSSRTTFIWIVARHQLVARLPQYQEHLTWPCKLSPLAWIIFGHNGTGQILIYKNRSQHFTWLQVNMIGHNRTGQLSIHETTCNISFVRK